MKRKYVQSVEFTLTSSEPESDSNALELEGPSGRIFMEIRCSKSGEHEVFIYPSNQTVVVPMLEIIRGFEIAKKKVVNFPVPPTDEAGNFIQQ